ncbi:hypothetical protein M426DRAFT_324071 [Hypoxylon sp. CI-4A]|nr:hypothetical protein M426DRAFT_324071 [Hypoxylon sp. CI-4A]
MTRKAGSLAAHALCIWPLCGCYLCVKYTSKAIIATVGAAWDAYIYVRVKTRRLPKSKPLAGGPTLSEQSSLLPPTTSSKTSFLHLPPEIRLQIYRLVLQDRAIAQVRAYSSFWGPRPRRWALTQGIRSDGEAPSRTLRTITGLGGSGLDQLVFPPSHGCVLHTAVSTLICGESHHLTPGWAERKNRVFHTDLMRTCRVVYSEMLDILYANNTISLYGAKISRYFCRNASPEGLSRVRYLHIAHVISPDSSSDRKEVKEAMRLVRDSLPGLKQLDVEIALTWSQPKDPEKFWTWLKGDLLGQFRGLERFVLKVSVYKTFTPVKYAGPDGWTPPYEALSSWKDDEYQHLKARVTSLDEAGMS